MRLILTRNDVLSVFGGRLEIHGASLYSVPASVYYSRNTGNGDDLIGKHGPGNISYSIYAHDRIGALEFNAFSDARIKHIQGLSSK